MSYIDMGLRDNDNSYIDTPNLRTMELIVRIEERENIIQDQLQSRINILETSDFRYDKCFVEALLEFRRWSRKNS